MPSYVVTGASRGIGFGFIEALSARKENEVFAIIRNPSTADDLQTLAKSHSNIHIVIGDATSSDDMIRAAEEVGKLTGGKLDVLINNVGGGTADDAKSPKEFEGKPQDLKAHIIASLDMNLFSAVFTIDAFLPLVKAGEEKKIICMSSGIADDALMIKTDISSGLGYAASKCALNSIVAKSAVAYRSDGLKFLALSPGWVKTRSGAEADGRAAHMLQSLQKLYPELTGQITVQDSVRMQLEVIDDLTLENSGQFLSQHGDKYWV